MKCLTSLTLALAASFMAASAYGQAAEYTGVLDLTDYRYGGTSVRCPLSVETQFTVAKTSVRYRAEGKYRGRGPLSEDGTFSMTTPRGSAHYTMEGTVTENDVKAILTFKFDTITVRCVYSVTARRKKE